MSRYAEGTEVPAERSRAEIERIISRYGATRFAYGWDAGTIVIQFEMRDRRVLFRLALPDPDDRAFRLTSQGRARSESARQSAYEQAVRQRWRALALVIKAKLESVESGIESFEEAFLPQIVLPGGMTVGGFVVPQIAAAYERAALPALLPGLSAGDVPALGSGR